MIKIDENVYQFEGLKAGQSYLVKENGLTLIDTGFKGDFKKIENQIKELGFKMKDIKTIILTHCHSDHCANVNKIKKYSNAKVIAHENEKQYFEKKDKIRYKEVVKKVFWLIMNTFFGVEKININKEVKDGDVIGILGGIRIIHTPGHTPGSMALYHPNKRILFSGDSLNNEKSFEICRGIYNTDDNILLQSVKKYLELNIEKICVGHGKSVLKDGKDKIKEVT